MATLNELKAAVDHLLGINSASSTLQLNSNTCERAFEAYVLGMCAEAVRRMGGQAELRGINSGPNPPVVVFRGGPGSMASTSQNFCYVHCSLLNKQFEIHLDIEYEGTSGATHEIDVSMYLSSRAALVRQTGRSPRSNSDLILAIECKFYEDAPGVALARTFVGLRSDCYGTRFTAFVSNKTSMTLSRFLSKPNSPEPFTDLTGLDSEAEERFIHNVGQELQKWAHKA